MVTVYGTFT